MATIKRPRNGRDDSHRKALRDRLLKSCTRPAQQSSYEELGLRLARLRPLSLSETPEQTIRAMRDGRRLSLIARDDREYRRTGNYIVQTPALIGLAAGRGYRGGPKPVAS